MEHGKKLYRSRKDRIFAGVCGGLGEYFDIEPLVFRAVFLVLIFGGGAGLLLYILLAIVIPLEPGQPVDFDRGEKIRTFAQDMGERAKHFGQEMKSEMPTHGSYGRSNRNILGIIIVLIGAFLLLNQIAPVAWFHWNFFWPALLIIIGIAIIAKHDRHI